MTSSWNFKLPPWIGRKQAALYLAGATEYPPMIGYELWLEAELEEEASVALLRTRYANGETISGSPLAYGVLSPLDETE